MRLLAVMVFATLAACGGRTGYKGYTGQTIGGSSVSVISTRAVIPAAPAPNGKLLQRNRSEPKSEPHDPM